MGGDNSPMATITNIQLRDRVAEYIKVKAVDVELDDESAAKIDQGIEDALAELLERGLVWWADNAIPKSCAFSMTIIVAAQVCAKFGKSEQGYEGGDSEGRARLVGLKQSTTLETVQADYF